MKQKFDLDPIQQKEDILVWKHGIRVDLNSLDLELTEEDIQQFFLTCGYSSLPVVSYRSEHPYLDKKIVAIKQIINMNDKQVNQLLKTIYKL